MKKKLFYYLFAVLCTATLFTSCSDDDDNGKNGDDQTEVTDISGNYKGNLVVSIDGSAADPVSQVISIAKSGDQTSQVILSLKKFSFAGQLVGDIEVPCTVEEKDGVQSFSGQKDLKFTTEFGQLLGTLPTSVSGTVKDGKVSMKIGVTVAALGQTVDVAFEGDKMTGNESSEAKISDFVIDSEFVTEQPVIDDENGTIAFKVNDATTNDDLKALIPTFQVSDKATNEKEEEVILDGNTITNSEYRVAIAQIKDGSDTEDKWVEFNEAFTYFEGKVYDSSKKYKMAIVCSSSKAGDSFKGAVNSTLFVDELEIIGE